MKHYTYQPQQLNNNLNFNNNFGESLHNWLRQFPEDKRLGFLSIALSISYIDEEEFSQLLNITIEKLFEFFRERIEKNLRSSSLITSIDDIKFKFQPYAISDSSTYDTFIHRVQISRTKDRDKKYRRGLLETLLQITFQSLREIAEYGEEAPYYSDLSDGLINTINSFLENPYILIIEDCSFSGTTIKSDLIRFLTLLDILFTPINNKHSTIVPEVFILIPIATTSAIEELTSNLNPRFRRYLKTEPFVGHLFDQSSRWNNNIPDSIEDLKDILNSKHFFPEVKKALEFFFEKYGKNYLKETNISKRTAMESEDFIFGYKKGAWTLVLFTNCPNNSLPPIWYPHTDSNTKEIIPLFQRVEARESHTTYASLDIDENIRISSLDEKHFVKKFLNAFYKSKDLL